MGIIINDALTLNTGQVLSNAYMSFGPNSIQLTKKVVDSTTTYECLGQGFIFVSEDAKNNGYAPINMNLIKVDLNASELGSNLFEKLYTQLKTNYTSTTDVL